MDAKQDELTIEYQYEPTPDAAERLARALDLILALILDDYTLFPDDDGQKALALGVAELRGEICDY